MIVLPNAGVPSIDGRRGLSAFYESGAASELAESPERWHLVAWPWNAELPLRLVLENDAHEALAFTVDEEGMWRLTPEPRYLKTRTLESIEEEKWGDQTEDRDDID